MTSLGQHGLPSPINSAVSPTTSHASSSNQNIGLPTQRRHPLIPGSPKEIALITYVDAKVLYITRRYATKFTDIKTKAKESPGYTTLEQFIEDLNPLIDLVWASGTSTLQIPYILNFAGMVASYMPAFPFTSRVFPLLKRLDTAFLSLLRSHETRPDSRPVVSITERVRIKSLVDETRVIAVRHASSAAGHTFDAVDVLSNDDDSEDEDADENETDIDMTAIESPSHSDSRDQVPSDGRRIAIALSKVYESTVAMLGDSLATPDVPVQVDDSMDTS